MGEARKAAEAWFTAIDKGDVDGAVQLLAEDVEFTSPSGTLKGRDEVRPFLGGYVTAFPGATFSIKNVWEQDDTAIVEGTYSGKHSGPMMTPDGQQIPPTGKWLDLPYLAVTEVEGGAIRSHRAYWDQVGFMSQLGMMEAPPGA